MACFQGVRVIAFVAVLGLALAACSEDRAESTAGVTMLSDVEPRNPDELRDGGNFRIAVDSIPVNFNPWHIDGETSYGSPIPAATLPRAFAFDDRGEPRVDHNYFTDISVIKNDPQQMLYTIDPRAVWSDGTSITWEDLRSQAEVSKSRERAFEFGYAGFSLLVDKVERGADDKQAVVTLARPSARWRELFAIVLPRSITATAEAFNTGARDKPMPSGGPFMIGEVDRKADRVVLVRNPKWWGPIPRLETITVSALDTDAWLPAIRNDELDAIQIDGDVARTAAEQVDGYEVRAALSPLWQRLSLVGASGRLLEDSRLRVAVSKAIDHAAIVAAARKDGVIAPHLVTNQVFVEGTAGYQDNAGATAYDPAAAGRMLDELGWRRNGANREKDGRTLELQYEVVGSPVEPGAGVVEALRRDLAAVGIVLDLRRRTRFPEHVGPYFGRAIDCGDPKDECTAPIQGAVAAMASYGFDESGRYAGPDIDNSRPYTANVGPDLYDAYGHGFAPMTPERRAIIDRIQAERDPARATVLLNEFDRMIWAAAYSVPLFRFTDAHVVRANLANWGPFGLATPDYTKIGFLQ